MYDDLHILVIGDIMLDLWREASDYRMYQEAPVPDIHNPESTYTLGGAGNVARIVRELGAEVSLVGVSGIFSPSVNNVEALCEKHGIGLYTAKSNRRTTVKERIVCHGQQICRISVEDTKPINDKCIEELRRILYGFEAVDGIIIADYSKGVMTNDLKRSLLHKPQQFPILVDPKNDFSGYNGCTIFKPNMKEANKYFDGYGSMAEQAWKLAGKLDCEWCVITSEYGMIIGSKTDENGHTDFPPMIDAHKVEVANVSGAGDAAAAVMLCEYVVSKDIELAVKMANYAASQIVATEHTGHLDMAKMIKFSAELAELIGVHDEADMS